MDTIVTCLSPNGTQESDANGAATRLLVGTLKGVARLERTGVRSPWRIAAQTLTDRHVGAVVYEPNSGKLFAAAHGDDGGLWVSDDGAGGSWRRIAVDVPHQHMYSLNVRQRGGKTSLWLGTEPAALYRSDDLGQTWRELPGILTHKNGRWTFPPPPHLAHVKNVTFHPSEPDTVFVCVEQGALLKSTDDGETWVELEEYSREDDAAYKDTHRLLINPRDPRKMYMTAGEGMYATTDGGAHWTHLTDKKFRIGYPDFIFFDSADPNTVYMGGAEHAPRRWRETQNSNACFSVSRDEGRTWSERTNGLPKPIAGAIEAMSLHRWPGGATLTMGTATGEIYASDNGGQSWEKIARVAPVSKDGHYRAFLPRTAGATPEARAH
jgi:photosystem II stability/assembly factor-like uncharacterized protein